MSAMPSNLAYISYEVGMQSTFIWFLYLTFSWFWTQKGTKEDVIYHPPEIPTAIKKKHRDLWKGIREEPNLDGGGYRGLI